MAGIESTLATPMEEMLQNLQFHNDAVMQIKSNIQNREMKLEETKQGQEMRHQAFKLVPAKLLKREKIHSEDTMEIFKVLLQERDHYKEVCLRQELKIENLQESLQDAQIKVEYLQADLEVAGERAKELKQTIKVKDIAAKDLERNIEKKKTFIENLKKKLEQKNEALENFEERFNIFRKKYDQLKEKNRRLAMEKEELEKTSQRYDKRKHWSDWGKRYLWKIVSALLLAVIPNYKEKVVEEVYSQNRLISKNIEKHDTHNKLDDQEEERACKIVEQEQLHKHLCLKDNPYAVAMKDTTCDLDFSECMLNDLTFDLIIFQYSVNFSGSNLVNTTFETCHFHKRSTYSFDRADLRNCTFKHCLGGNNFGWSREELMKMVREKRVTFDNVKNFDEAVFENDIKKLIKEMYHL